MGGFRKEKNKKKADIFRYIYFSSFQWNKEWVPWISKVIIGFGMGSLSCSED